MRVIGIDPGYERLGIAILDKTTGKEQLVHSECFRTNSKIPHSARLKELGQTINAIIEEYNPEALAIETLFLQSNQKTVMPVAEARGVVMYEAALKNLPVFEYSPPQIKVAVTGHGRSDKKQVIDMVGKLIKINKKIQFDDEYDAIAVGLTYFACESFFRKRSL